jgi:alpha-tubulin suppressor-like RCC1 family protein
VLVDGGHNFAWVSAGGDHTCGVLTNGDARCWGANWGGQLGDLTFTESNVPVLVAGAHDFTSVSAASSHTCGVLATSDPGDAYCWGVNYSGQLGDGTTTHSNVPVLVLGGIDFVSVSTGSDHSCGTSIANIGYCWGANWNGQLGNGTSGNQEDEPDQVSGGLSLTSIVVGSGHTCGITSADEVYCWGGNWDGQLGDGTTSGINEPVQIVH